MIQDRRSTTYLCRSERCCTCGSVRTSRGVGEFVNDQLVNCSDCHKTKIEKPKVPIFRYPRRFYKWAYRDVACRYLQIFGGRTHREITAIDDFEIYLVDRNDEVIAKVSPFDRFPKPLETTDFDDIPF